MCSLRLSVQPQTFCIWVRYINVIVISISGHFRLMHALFMLSAQVYGAQPVKLQ